MATPIELIVVRLYRKSPGSPRLRKSSAAELATLEAAGWQEKQRTTDSDHVVVRLERPRPVRQTLRNAQGGMARPGH